MFDEVNFFYLYYKSKYIQYKHPFITIPVMLFILNFIVLLTINALEYYDFYEVDNHISNRRMNIVCEKKDIYEITGNHADVITDYYRLYPPVESLTEYKGYYYNSNLINLSNDELPNIIEGNFPQNKNEVLVPNNTIDVQTGVIKPINVNINDKLRVTINGNEHELIVSGIYDIFKMYEYKENINYIHSDFYQTLQNKYDDYEVYRIICNTSIDCEKLILSLSNRYTCYKTECENSIHDEQDKISLALKILYVILVLSSVMSIIVFICFIIKAIDGTKNTNRLCYILGANRKQILFSEIRMIVIMVTKTYIYSIIFEALTVLLLCVYINFSFVKHCTFRMFVFVMSFYFVIFLISLITFVVSDNSNGYS